MSRNNVINVIKSTLSTTWGRHHYYSHQKQAAYCYHQGIRVTSSSSLLCKETVAPSLRNQTKIILSNTHSIIVSTRTILRCLLKPVWKAKIKRSGKKKHSLKRWIGSKSEAFPTAILPLRKNRQQQETQSWPWIKPTTSIWNPVSPSRLRHIVILLIIIAKQRIIVAKIRRKIPQRKGITLLAKRKQREIYWMNI